MFALPLSFLFGTLASFAALALLAGGIALLAAAVRGALDPALAWAGAAMVLWALGGRCIVMAAFPRGEAPPPAMRGGSGKKIQAPDGSVLHVEFDGPAGAPAIVLTQGWGMDLRAWQAVRRRLSERYRLLLWDLPGVGRSRPPADGGYSVVRMAEDLRRVIDEAGQQPVVVVGHGIGGMMILSLCRLHPDLQGRRVKGIVMMSAPFASPLAGAAGAGLLRVLRWPLLEPLLLFALLLWPLAWLLSLLGYASGFLHLAVRLCAMGRAASREQVELVVRSGLRNKPAILARGLRAMLRFDESKTPPRIPVAARVIGGERDRLVRPATLERLAGMIRGADRIIIAGAGHYLPLEAPVQVADAIAELADRAGAAGRTPERPAQE